MVHVAEVVATPSPYGDKPVRWIKPVLLSVLLVAFDEQGVIAFLLGVFLVLVYLPRSLLAKKYSACRKERLYRFGIYVMAVAMVFGLRVINAEIAKQRAGAVIAAVETYQERNGKFPDRLDQLVPGFVSEIPSKAKITFMDTGFRYQATDGDHSLTYVSFPPFGRRVYQFEKKEWSDLD